MCPGISQNASKVNLSKTSNSAYQHSFSCVKRIFALQCQVLEFFLFFSVNLKKNNQHFAVQKRHT